MPGALTAAGFVTVLPPNVQVVVKPAVVNKVVRFLVLSVHFVIAWSAPKAGATLKVTFTIAVSAQPLLLAAINW